MYIWTIHSICLRILEENRDFTRLKRNFKMMDQFDQRYFVYQHLNSFRTIEDIETLLERTEASPYITFEKSDMAVRETVEAFDYTVQNIKKRNYYVKSRPKQHCLKCDMRYYCNKKERDGEVLD